MILTYYDLEFYKIPNVIILISEIIRIIILSINHIDIVYIIIRTSSNYIIFFLLYLILKIKIKVSAGDMKLFSLMVNYLGREKGLLVIFISLLISIFPLLKGAKKVPMSFMALLSLSAFSLFDKRFFI